jgi:hypothetical protein
MKYVSLIFISLLLSACSVDGTSTGNPAVSMRFESYDASSAKVSAMSGPISNVKLCFKRLRLKTESSDTSTDSNIDFDLGEISLNPSGTDLTMLQVPQGTYRRLEMDLDSSCSSGQSVQLTNSAGSFQSNDSISIRFEGEITITSTSSDLPLAIQAIINQMKTITSNAEVKTKMESVAGGL